MDRTLRRDRGRARCGALRERGAAGQAGAYPWHRGRPDLLFRHQVFRADEGPGHGHRRQGSADPWRLLRGRCVPAGGGDHRSLPRRERHQVAGAGGAVPRRPSQPEAGQWRYRRRLRELVCRAHRQGHRRAVRRPRRASRREVRDRRPDRHSLAGDGRPQEPRGRQGRIEASQRRRARSADAGRRARPADRMSYSPERRCEGAATRISPNRVKSVSWMNR